MTTNNAKKEIRIVNQKIKFLEAALQVKTEIHEVRMLELQLKGQNLLRHSLITILS